MELEAFIETIDGVELVAVVGIPDPVAVDLPAAVVIKQKLNETLTEQKIIEAVAARFPTQKHLTGGVYFVDELPMTPNGKIQKRFVRDIAIKRRANLL